MAISRVQHKEEFKAFNAAGTNPHSLSFTSNPTAGNLIIVVYTYYSFGGAGSQSPVISDNQTGNTYSLIGSERIASDSATALDVWYAKNINSSGTFTISVQITNAESNCLAIYEYAGVDTVSPLTTNNGNTGLSATADPGSVVPSVNGSLIFSAGQDNTGSAHTVTAQTNYSLVDNDNAQTPSLYTEELIQGTAASTDPSFGISSSVDWAAQAGVFRPPATSKGAPLMTMMGVGM